MKAVSLFSGIGGFDLGFERAGIETVLQVEIDPFCRKVLEKHWPNVRRIADVRDVTEADVQGVDVVYGGFPCQPVSYAGKRKAQEDERWLWPEFERVIRMARPRYVVVENVPGLLTAGLGDVLAGLSSLGFDAEWSIVSACSVGAPHPRERLFLMAYPEGIGRDWWWDGGSRSQDEPQGRRQGTGWSWPEEPRPIGVVDGIPHRVDRLRSSGNAVVPQVADLVGRMLVDFDASIQPPAPVQHLAWVGPGLWGGQWRAVCCCGERSPSWTGSSRAHAWREKHEAGR